MASHHCRAVSLGEPTPSRAAVHHGSACGFRAVDAARHGSAAKCRGVVAVRYGPEANVPVVLLCGVSPRRNSSACMPCAMSRRGISRRDCKAAWVSIQPSGRGGGAAWTGIGVPRGAAARYGFASKWRRAGPVRCGCGSKWAAIPRCSVGAGRNGRRYCRVVWVGTEIVGGTFVRCGWESKCSAIWWCGAGWPVVANRPRHNSDLSRVLWLTHQANRAPDSAAMHPQVTPNAAHKARPRQPARPGS